MCVGSAAIHNLAEGLVEPVAISVPRGTSEPPRTRSPEHQCRRGVVNGRSRPEKQRLACKSKLITGLRLPPLRTRRCGWRCRRWPNIDTEVEEVLEIKARSTPSKTASSCRWPGCCRDRSVEPRVGRGDANRGSRQDLTRGPPEIRPVRAQDEAAPAVQPVTGSLSPYPNFWISEIRCTCSRIAWTVNGSARFVLGLTAGRDHQGQRYS
jgi:hypothetical protein